VSTTFVAMLVAIIVGVGLLVTIGALSLLSGALNFLFVKPKIEILKSKFGKEGFAFSFHWDQDAEPVRFDRVRVKLQNPFGNPSQIEVIRDFDPSGVDFVRDVEMGKPLENILSASNIEKALVEVTMIASKDSQFHTISFKGQEFIDKFSMATVTAEELASKYVVVKEKPKFEIPERSFISPPLPKSAKALKLATNPIFAGDFAGAGASGAGPAAAAVADFSVTKVWIEPGCIVCDACEAIEPDVFDVQETTCVIRPGAPLDHGLKIQEAAEACPVEVIKFTKA